MTQARFRHALIVAAVLVVASLAFARDYPPQLVNRVDAVHFGERLREVEHRLEVHGHASDSPVAEPTDRIIESNGVTLTFDADRLDDIAFTSDSGFAKPMHPYPEAWRNFEPIGRLHIAKRMSKSQFLSYLAAWEERAKTAGAIKCDSQRLLKQNEYHLSVTEDELIDMISIGFGPERSTGKGGSWGDGVSVSFESKDAAFMDHRPLGELEEIDFFCDEFNTRARPPVLKPIDAKITFKHTFPKPDHPPSLSSWASPDYPEILKRFGIEGTVLVALVVNADGSPGEVECTKATDRRFAEAAVAAVKEWRFKPSTLNGTPVPTTIEIPIVFTLHPQKK